MKKELGHKGFVIGWNEPPLVAGKWQVGIASNSRNLMSLLQQKTGNKGAHVIDGQGFEDAIKNARAFIDGLVKTKVR